MFSAEIALMAILTGGALVPLVGKMIALIESFYDITKTQKRMLAAVVTVVVSATVYFLATAAGYWPNPFATEEWVRPLINDLVYLSALNFTSCQLILSGFRTDNFHESIGSANRYVSRKMKHLEEVKDGSAKTDLSVLFK